MSDHSHPYTKLPQCAFWKPAVADVDFHQIDLAWKPKSPITRETKIITVGSCFAQHISKSLKDNGFSWLDSEPAPAVLPKAEHAKHGYGVFSFRTGNIYTAALLKQWVMWATGKAEQSTESFLEDGRYFDPYRPSLTEDGFSSAEEMLAARQNTLAAMLEAIKQADLFVFTLGLTEAWLKKDGSVYPMCPGTIRGTFSPEDHVFHNYNEQEVVRDLAGSFDELRNINPNLRFLLTVSPVPLTATASGQHVLTATTYSKSVLRSAAGYLTQSREDTDYFPSYELITAPAFKGRFFEQNMRSVSSDGVAFVMGQFLRSIGAGEKPAHSETSVGPKAVASGNSGKAASGPDICDDIILETWSNKPIDDSEEQPNVLLIGDSQMGMIAKALDEQGIRYAGGAIMHGSEWHKCHFQHDETRYFLPNDADARERWMRAFSESLARSSSASDVTIITNIGAHSFQIFGEEFEEYLAKVSPVRFSNIISDSNLANFLALVRQPHLGLVKRFVEAGCKVVWVSDPPFQPNPADIHGRMDKVLSDNFLGIGCLVFHARDWVRNLGKPLPELRSSEINPGTGELDWVHGSPEYYRQLTKEIFNRFSIKPPAPAMRVGATAVASNGLGKAASGTDICDDIILETWSNKPVDDSEEPPNILLIGDSQMGMIAKALDEQGIRYAGGAIMHSSQWHTADFAVVDGKFIEPFAADAKAKWDEAYQRSLAKYAPETRGSRWIITNIGMHSRMLNSKYQGIDVYLDGKYGYLPGQIDPNDLMGYLQAARTVHANLLRKFVASGYNVVWVTDPPCQPTRPEVYAAMDQVLSHIFGNIVGCGIFNAREWITRLGEFPAQFRSTEVDETTGELDFLHGSPEYYRQLTKEIFRQFQIESSTSAMHAGVAAVPLNAAQKTESETDICDDIILETWSNKRVDDSEEPPNILLIGDSQMGMIAKALDEQGIRYAGGAIMHGSEWHGLQFTMLEDMPYFVPTNAEARSRWEEACSHGLLTVPESARSDMWILTNIGFHANQILTMDGVWAYMQDKYGKAKDPNQRGTMSVADLHNYLLFARMHHFTIVNKFRKAGFKTLWIGDPPVDLSNGGFYEMTEQILSEKFRSIGCPPFSPRKWIADKYGALPTEFLSSEIDSSTGHPDVVHGAPEYYRQLVKELFCEFGIQPRYRQVG